MGFVGVVRVMVFEWLGVGTAMLCVCCADRIGWMSIFVLWD